MANEEIVSVVYISDNEVAQIREILTKYPIENTDEWFVSTENNLDYLIARDQTPINDPWMRLMKRWAFDQTDSYGSMWTHFTGTPPSIANNESCVSMCYTTINKKIIKLWRSCEQ
jgi:hypothetical protein